MDSQHFLIITGMSGAGKSQVLRTLEDLDYFCVDNLPAALIPKFAELCRPPFTRSVGLVVDARGGEFFAQLGEILDDLDQLDADYELLFLDSDDETLIRRYKETRRPHPLQRGKNLASAVARERELLHPIRQRARVIIDTTTLKPKELTEKIRQLYATAEDAAKMSVIVQSFGFKHGLPLDSDLVLDVRFLPNPFYVQELKPLTGNDPEVDEYLMRFKQTSTFLRMWFELLDFLLPKYIDEGKSQLVISVGCTGGQHRSVFIANKIYDYLRMKEYFAQIMHRDIALRK